MQDKHSGEGLGDAGNSEAVRCRHRRLIFAAGEAGGPLEKEVVALLDAEGNAGKPPVEPGLEHLVPCSGRRHRRSSRYGSRAQRGKREHGRSGDEDELSTSADHGDVFPFLGRFPSVSDRDRQVSHRPSVLASAPHRAALARTGRRD